LLKLNSIQTAFQNRLRRSFSIVVKALRGSRKESAGQNAKATVSRVYLPLDLLEMDKGRTLLDDGDVFLGGDHLEES
jgi:hypothetical protein